MTREQAIQEAIRRSKIKVTRDGRTEQIYVCYEGNDQFSTRRWIDIPYGTRLVLSFVAGKETPRFEPETKQ